MEDFHPEHPFPLSVLNSWPMGSLGRTQDNVLIRQAKALADKYGPDRVAKAAEAIEAIWRSPEHPKGRDWPDTCTDNEIRGVDESAMLALTLNEMCKQHGYGRIPQLFSTMADVLLRPETIEKHKNFHDERMAHMEEARRMFAECPGKRTDTSGRHGLTPEAT